MKAPRFKYARPESVDEAVEMLSSEREALILAGGQSLMPVLNMRLASPSLLIDINWLRELGGIEMGDGMLRIGALTRHREVADSPLVREHVPLIADAMRHVGHPAIQNRGTFGGSLATADPSAEMPACCVALGARIRLRSKRGHRSVAAEDFFRGIFETAREPDELLVAVEIPIPGPSWRSCFIEFVRRHGDFAIAGIAANTNIESDRISDIRIALFGVEARPTRLRRAEEAIIGARTADNAFATMQAELTNTLEPMSDVHASGELRLHYARVLLERVTRQLSIGPA